MEITISKIVAVVIALGYAIAIIVNVGFTTHATSVLLLFVPISAAMFRFTIRDVLWLTVVMSDISS